VPLGPEPADDAHYVGNRGIARPELVGLGQRLGKAEVEVAGEELMPAVHRARGEELAGTDQPERFAELVADEILTAFAARQ